MSKTKNKEHSELEFLRGLVRKLKSQNRNLRKRNKELERKSHFYEDIVDNVIEEENPELKLNACPECGKGLITELDFKHILLKKCSICEYKERIKK